MDSIDAAPPAKKVGAAPLMELRICPKCQQQKLRRKHGYTLLPLGKYRCQSCKAEMVLPLRFQGRNRKRYLFSALLIGGVSAAIAFGIHDLFGEMPGDSADFVESIELPDQQARHDGLPDPERSMQGMPIDASGIANPNELVINPALAEQAVLPPSAPTLPAATALAAPPSTPAGMAGSSPEAQGRTTLPMPSLKASPDASSSQEPAAASDTGDRPVAKLVTALPVALPSTALAAKPAALPEPPKAKIVASMNQQPAATPAAVLKESDHPAPKSLFAPAQPAAPKPEPVAPAPAPAPAQLATTATAKVPVPDIQKPVSQETPPAEEKAVSRPEADNTLKGIKVSHQGGATRITLTTAKPSEAIRMSQVASDNAYVVDFPGDWAVASSVARLLRPSDPKVLHIEIKQTSKYLRVLLFCVPDVINEPLVNANGDGFTITVR